jgi:phosphopantetheinyl transferase
VISTSPEGAPLIEGHPELHVSISHSGCFAVAAIASHRIGVDLEENVPRPPSLVRYFFEPREQVLLARRGARAQTSLVNELWCRKEAACKVGHWGGSLPFREVDGTRPHVTIAGRAIGLRSGATDQFAAAIAWESSPSALPADPRIQIPSGAREVRRG